MKNANPPSLATRFFEWFCNRQHLEGLEGDLYELFERRVQEKGRTRAQLYYLIDLASLLRSSVARSFNQNKMTNQLGMLHNYFKTALRMGMKRKGFSFINLLGLTLGLTSVLFIAVYVQDELSYDEHISQPEMKYRMYNIRQGLDGETNYLPIVPPAFALSLRSDFPQVKKIGRAMMDFGGTVFNVENQAFSEKDGLFAEPQILDILDIQLLAGSFSEDTETKSVLLSQSLFKKFFGDVPYSEQTLKLTRSTLKVVGIFEDLPERSHLKLDYIFPFKWIANSNKPERMKSWVWQQFFTYIELEQNVDSDIFLAQFRNYVRERSEEETLHYGFTYTPHLQNIKDVHLHSSGFEWEIAKTNSYQSILFLIIAAAIILLIACLNFINLSTAQAIKRAKEVSVRKFIGASRFQLIIQYAFESTLYTLSAGIISLILFLILLEPFNLFTDKSFTNLELLTVENIVIYVGALLLLGIVAGWYPAMLITRFNVLATLRGGVQFGHNKFLRKLLDPRQLMVGVQYVLSIGLILISLIMQNQYQFLRTTDMGFKKENLLVIPLTRALESDLEATRSAFLSHSSVTNVSYSYGVPGGIIAGDGIFIPSKKESEFSSSMFMVDQHYINTLGIKLIAGRDFSDEFKTDQSNAFVINETAVRNFGFESPEDAIDTPVNWKVWDGTDTLKRGKIIGVIADFNHKSLHSQVSSSVLHIEPSYFQNMIIRINGKDPLNTLEFLEVKYREYEPTRPFEPEFVDATFKEYYTSENRLSQLFGLFTILAILTASIGLFGLVSYSITNRMKEISIRKVLGAKTNALVKLLVSRYLSMVLVCIGIAFPLAYWLSSQWLENFAYHIEIGVWTFVPVAIAMILLTLLTVGFQALKGSLANPSDQLRNE